MYPHRIRLRGPWEYQPLDPAGAGGRAVLPALWADIGLNAYTGRVRFRRRFGYPGRIDDHERVWLTCAGLADRADVHLNGKLLAENLDGGQPFEFDVTVVLQARNELLLDVTGGPDGGPWGEVALEVRCTAYLRNLHISVIAGKNAPVVQVQGEAVGTADGPLELYAILNRSNAAYAVVTPRPEGQPFVLTSDEIPAERWPGEDGAPPVVQVDLVNGALVWYTWRRELPASAGEVSGV